MTVSVAKYQGRFDSVIIQPIPFVTTPTSVSGIITLPAKSTMIAEYSIPYILDSADFQTLMQTLTYNPANTFQTLSELLNISIDSVKTLIISSKLSTNFSIKNWQPDYGGIIPTIKIILPATIDTISINESRLNSINFPGYILASTTNIYLPDTIFHYGAGFKVGYMSGDSITTRVFSNDSLIYSDSTYGRHINNRHPMITGMVGGFVPNTRDSLHLLRFEHIPGEHTDTASELNQPIQISVYPNPASENIQISLSNRSAGIKANLYNISGQIVQSIGMYNESVETMDLSNISNGAYIIVISNGETQISRKIIVSH
jgi:hypothetical protein